MTSLRSKALASGMPIGVTIANEEIMDWEGGSMPTRLEVIPVACSAGSK